MNIFSCSLVHEAIPLEYSVVVGMLLHAFIVYADFLLTLKQVLYHFHHYRTQILHRSFFGTKYSVNCGVAINEFLFLKNVNWFVQKKEVELNFLQIYIFQLCVDFTPSQIFFSLLTVFLFCWIYVPHEANPVRFDSPDLIEGTGRNSITNTRNTQYLIQCFNRRCFTIYSTFLFT